VNQKVPPSLYWELLNFFYCTRNPKPAFILHEETINGIAVEGTRNTFIIETEVLFIQSSFGTKIMGSVSLFRFLS
jgi:hypothetical protein